MKIYLKIFQHLEGFIISIAFCGIFFISDGIVRSSSLLLIAANQDVDSDKKRNVLTFILPLAIYHFTRLLKSTLLKERNFGILSLFWSNILCIIGAASCFWATTPTYVIITWGVIFGIGYGMKGIFKLKTENGTNGQALPQCNTVTLSGYVGCLIASPVLQILIEMYGFHGSCLLVASIFFNSAALAFAISVLGKGKDAGHFGSKNQKLSKSSDDIYSIYPSNGTSGVTQSSSEKNSSIFNPVSNNPDTWQKCLEDKLSFLSKSSSELQFSSASSSEIQAYGKQLEMVESSDISIDKLKKGLFKLSEETIIAIAESASNQPLKERNEKCIKKKLDTPEDCSLGNQLQLTAHSSDQLTAYSLLDSETGLKDNGLQHSKSPNLQSPLDQLVVDSTSLTTKSHLNSTTQKENVSTSKNSILTKGISESLDGSKLNKNCSKMQNTSTTQTKSMEKSTAKTYADDQNVNYLQKSDVMLEPETSTHQEVMESMEKIASCVSILQEDGIKPSDNPKTGLDKKNVKKQEDVKGFAQVKVKVIEYIVDTEKDIDWIGEMNLQPKKIYRRHANSVSGKYFENMDSNLSLDPAPCIPELSGFQRKLSHVKLAVEDIRSQQHKFGNEFPKSNHHEFARLYEKVILICLVLIKASHRIVFPLITAIIADLATNHGATFYNAKWSIVAYSGGCILGNRTLTCLAYKNISKVYVSLAAFFAGTGVMLFCILPSSTFAGFLCFMCFIGVFESSAEVMLHILKKDFFKRKNVELVVSTSNFVSGVTLLIIPFAMDLFGDLGESYDSLLHTLIIISFVNSVLCLALSRMK